jgi:hypothetical protein
MKLINLKGKRFGRLHVLYRDETSKRTKWICQCDCGNIKSVPKHNLTSGQSVSCGCYQRECAIKRSTTHNKTNTKLYYIWSNIKQRCYNKNSAKYKNYGMRAVKVCEEWLNDFELFYIWSIDNGYEQGLSLDRIDVNGNYEPKNCRWVTMKVQQNNKTINLNVTIDGTTKTARQWEEEYNLSHGTIKRRLSLNWDEKDLLNQPEKSSKQSDVRGVSWDKNDELWRVRVSDKGKVRSIGSSKNLQIAIQIKEDFISKLK